MSRKSLSFGALVAFAIANMVFSSAHSAEVEAHNGIAPAALAAPGRDNADDMIELVPVQPALVSEPIVQPLPAEPQPNEGAVPAAASLSALVQQMDGSDALSTEMQCLAAAVYFESRGEPLAGQLAVAQVVINRAEDPRFPASYCGVVHQPGQFSFVKQGRMPHIRRGSAAWTQARAIAQIAHQGLWPSEADTAIFFHARYVRPGWSERKQRLAQINTHIFYR